MITAHPPPALPPSSLTTRGSELQDELRAARAEAEAEAGARQAAEAAAARAQQDQRAAAEQLEAARRGRGEAAAEAAELQGRVAELEAAAALYIAKEARGWLGCRWWWVGTRAWRPRLEHHGSLGAGLRHRGTEPDTLCMGVASCPPAHPPTPLSSHPRMHRRPTTTT